MEGNNIGGINNSSSSSSSTRGVIGLAEKKQRPQEQLNCPRCNSSNTKFCYYNNYSLTQPRYFCKTCRRYWTEGGSLRNVPVGGGSRKNKKPFTSSSSSSSPKVLPDLNPPAPTISSASENPKIFMHGGQDLNLGFPSSSSSNSSSSSSALELLRAGMASRGLSLSNHIPYVHNPMLMANSSNAIFPSGFNFPMQEVKPGPGPGLGFSVDQLHGIGSRYGIQENNNNNNNDDNVNGGSGRVFFPFGDHVNNKQISGTHHEVEQSKDQQQGNPSSGYWTGMIGEGSW